ncbi:MAG: DUF305 domain-containing protein [Actinobacteria bacterium]|nr:DUF305 domain-containing protein [Actinomycetota bacterium]
MLSAHTVLRRTSAALGAAALLLLGTPLAGCGAASGGSSPATPAATSLDPAAAAAQDAAFAAAMIDHHHRTLQLVGLSAEHAENPAILSYAGELQTLHENQMAELADLMTGWGKSPPHIEGHTDLGDSIPGVLDKAQLAALVASPAAEFEKTFLATLVTQQRKALPIAQKELQLGADPVAKKYAQQVLIDVNNQLETLKTLRQPS